MAAMIGRGIALSWGAATIAGVRQKAVSVDGAPVDVTSDEDSGWQTILTVAGQQSVGLSLSGITKDKKLKTDFFAGTRTKEVILTYPDGSTFTGSFYLASYKETGAYNDAVTFEADLQSTGAVVWAAGA